MYHYQADFVFWLSIVWLLLLSGTTFLMFAHWAAWWCRELESRWNLMFGRWCAFALPGVWWRRSRENAWV